METPEPPILYTCHLCAIEVPATFATDHAASLKHQANVRIASVAAERMRAFISAPTPHAVQTSARFCAYCSIETNEEHENTNEHRAAVILDNLLWDLMKAYVKDHETKHHEMPSNESNKKDKVNDEKYNVNFKHSDKNNKNSKYMSNMAINDNQPMKRIEDKVEQDGGQIEKNSETNHNLEKSDNNNVTVNNTDNINLSTNLTQNAIPILKSDNKYYGEELHKFMDNQDIFEYKEIVKISIKFNDNIINNIDSDHYHSYERMCEDDTIKCILCDCVLNDEDAYTHKYELEHMRKVANLGKDGHYIREINKFYSHCILCNLKIENINLVTHTQSATHSVKEYLYTNTRSGNLNERRDETNNTNIKLTENNEIEEPNEYLENLSDKKNPNHDYNSENEEFNDNGDDYSEIQEIYDTLEEYSDTDESSDNHEEYDENDESDMSIYEHIENGDPMTYLQYLEQYCKCEESIISIHDDSSHFIYTLDSSKEFSENQNPNDNLSVYLINQQHELNECNANNNLEESINKFLKECCETGDPKDNLHGCNKNEESGENLDKCSKSEELYDNLETVETYSKNDEFDLDKCIREEPDNNINQYSENEKLMDNLEICNEDEEFNMSTYGESNHSRVTIDDSSELNSENGEPVTYLQYLEQLCKNEESSMSIHDDSTSFIGTIDDSSEGSYNEEFGDNSEDNCGYEEINDKVEEPNEDKKITNDNTNITLCTNEIDAKKTNQGKYSIGKKKTTNISVDLQKIEIKFPFETLTLTSFGLVRCIVCKRFLDINKMKPHIKGKRHRRMIKKKHNATKPKEENTKSIQEESKQDVRKLNVDDSQKYGDVLRKYIAIDANDFFEFEETFITVEIKTEDNILKTYSDRFHSYNRFNDKGTINCLVCDCTFKDGEDQNHKYDLNHIRKIANLGKDDHYIREIDETYSHCILCNLKIENTNVAAHKDMFSHKFGKRLFTRSVTRRNNEDTTTAKDDTLTQRSSPVTDQAINNCKFSCDSESNDADQEFKVETSQINNTRTDNPINPKCNKATDHKDFNTDNDIKEENSELVELTSAVKKETDEYIANENNIKDYGDELRKLIDTKRAFEFNERGNVIRIKMDDKVISIYNDHFHSFDRTYYSRRLKCIVCDCILNFEDAEEHKYDLKHMRRIINLGHDQHYVRKMNDSYSHCIICNLKIKNEHLDTHKRLLLHTTKKDLYTSKTDDIILEVTTQKSENEIPGDQEVKTAKRDKAMPVDKVSNEKKENSKTAATVKPIDIIVGTKTEYPYEVTADGNLRCVVCECQVPNSAWNKEEHVNGVWHRNLVWYRYA